MKLSSLNNIKKTQLFSTLRISFTHHSNAIEGISLTFGETQKLLTSGQTAVNRQLSEQLVVLGFADAFDFVLREASNTSSALDDTFIKDIHAILFEKAMAVTPEKIEKPIGAWRLDERRIQGVDVSLSNPTMIAQDIGNLCYLYYNNKKEMTLKDIAHFHIEFEKIHPFADGNGRVGRLLMAYQAIKNNMIPPLILNEHQKTYLESFQSVEKMSKFLEGSIKHSLTLVRVSSIRTYSAPTR